MARNTKKQGNTEKRDDEEKEPRAEKYTIEFTPKALLKLKVPKPKKDPNDKDGEPKPVQDIVWDKGQRGLSILLSSGGTKTYRSLFKLPSGWKSRRIGRVGEFATDDELIEKVGIQKFEDDMSDDDKVQKKLQIEIDKARAIVANDRAIAKQGRDPRAQDQEREAKARLSAETTFEVVVDRFIKQRAQHRQRTWKQTQAVLKRNCLDWLKRPITSITYHDAEHLLEGFIAKGHHAKAAVTLAWIRTLWTWAWKKGYVPEAVMDRVDVAIVRASRDRHFTDNEVKSIWKAAETLKPIEEGYTKSLLLLAPRKSELARARRSELDDPKKPTAWTCPFERTKSRKTAKARVYVTPLPPLATRVIKALPKKKGDPDLLFPGAHHGKPISPGGPLKRKLVKAGAPSDFNYHTVRHTVATWLRAQGYDDFDVGLVLNHSKGTVTSGYIHSIARQRKLELLTAWADHVEALVTPKGTALLK